MIRPCADGIKRILRNFVTMKHLIFASATILAASMIVTAHAQDTQSIYDSTCVACHLSGVAGAPKPDDKAAWAPRLEKGADALLESVKNGLNAMPPKGTCMTCSDEQLAELIELMTKEVK